MLKYGKIVSTTLFSENRFFKNSDFLTVNNEGGYNNFKLEVKSFLHNNPILSNFDLEHCYPDFLIHDIQI